MVAFFELVQGFFQFIMDGLSMSIAFVLQFIELITGGLTLMVNVMSPFPFLLTCMVFAVLMIAIIKLILSLVGVII